jgi:hypothetical protein
MEGQGVSRPATVAGRPNSAAEQRPEVDVVSRGARGEYRQRCALRVERGHRQRHGGNGHGDVARLQSRIPSGGVKYAARTMSVLPPTIRFAGSRYGNPAPRNAANPMTGSGMQQARDLRAEETVEVVRNHEDGTGFRGWLLETEARSDARWSGRSAAVTRDALAHHGVGGGEIGARSRGAAKAASRVRTAGRIPREEVEVRPGAAARALEGSEGPRVRTKLVLPQGRVGVGAVPSEHLEGPRGNAQGQGGSGKPPFRYDHAAVIFLSSGFGRRYARPLKVA